MKNAIISVVIFLCLFLSIFLLNNFFLELCTDIKYKTDEIEYMLTNNDIEKSYKSSLDLLNFLQRNNFITSIYVNHQEFDLIKYETVKLCIYIGNNDFKEADASLHVIKYEIQAIKDLQKISLNNIF